MKTKRLVPFVLLMAGIVLPAEVQPQPQGVVVEDHNDDPGKLGHDKSRRPAGGLGNGELPPGHSVTEQTPPKRGRRNARLR